MPSASTLENPSPKAEVEIAASGGGVEHRHVGAHAEPAQIGRAAERVGAFTRREKHNAGAERRRADQRRMILHRIDTRRV